MKEWRNKGMKGWKDEGINEWSNEEMKEWMIVCNQDEWMLDWIDDW